MFVEEVGRARAPANRVRQIRNTQGRKQRAAAVAVAVATSESSGSPARQRAIARRLVELERENYNESVKIEIPKLHLSGSQPTKVGLTVASRRILGSKKTLANHFDDDPASTRLFMEAAAPRSKYPPREVCSVCGFWGTITCMRCSARYCSRPCEETHQDTRCLKVYA